MLFWPILGHFCNQVVTLVTLCSTLSNFKKNPKVKKKNLNQKINKTNQNPQKTQKNQIKIQKIHNKNPKI